MDAKAADLSPMMVGDYTLPDGRKAQPVFHLLAERYLAPEYAPEAVAERCGITAATIRRIAAEIADVAFNQPLVLDQPWTDVWGNAHTQTIGRPVAFHAMRGISAHCNGFHSCRALHLLQMLLGAVDTPGSWRYKSPFPRPIPPGPPPAGKGAKPNTPLVGNLLSFPQGPDDLLVDDAGNPLRIDKAFSWEAPMALHGMMHTVIGNAGAGDPYPIDTLFMFMANMAWNSAMNPGEVIRILTEKRADGEHVIPHVIYSDAYYSETVPYADLILPDTTYLERWDCISVLDRPIGSAHGAGDAIRQPVITPDRDVRPFQDVLIELGARLGLPAFTKEDGSREVQGLPGLHRQPPARAGRRPAGRLPRRGWHEEGRRRAEPGPAAALHRQWLLLARPPAAGAALVQARQPGLSRQCQGHGLHPQGRADRHAALVGAAAEIPPRRRGPWRAAAAGSPARAHPHLLRPAAHLVRAAGTAGRRPRALRPLRRHPAADGDVPFLGLDECLAAADPRLQQAVHGAQQGRGAGAGA